MRPVSQKTIQYSLVALFLVAWMSYPGLSRQTQVTPVQERTISHPSLIAQLGTISSKKSHLNTLPSPKTVPISPPQSVATGTVLVTRVVDGDTIELANGERVRYVGIDTPETVKPNTPVQCYGHEASLHNTELVEGKYVRLVRDVEDRDKYGRLLRYVYVGDTFINLALVENGYARMYTYPPNVAHVNEFRVAQESARTNKRGLWGDSCSGITSTPKSSTTPLPIVSSTSPTSPCTIKGNISNSGEKIYHRPDCPYYTRTKITIEKGEHMFCTEPEAISAGWRIAGNCPQQ